jgi:hypothetical protein
LGDGVERRNSQRPYLLNLEAIALLDEDSEGESNAGEARDTRELSDDSKDVDCVCYKDLHRDWESGWQQCGSANVRTTLQDAKWLPEVASANASLRSM